MGICRNGIKKTVDRVRKRRKKKRWKSGGKKRKTENEIVIPGWNDMEESGAGNHKN